MPLSAVPGISASTSNFCSGNTDSISASAMMYTRPSSALKRQ